MPPLARFVAARDGLRPGDSWQEVSRKLNAWATSTGEWAGVPCPLPGLGLVVEDKNPYKARLAQLEPMLNPLAAADPEDLRYQEINTWHSAEKGGTVRVYRDVLTGKVGHVIDHDAPKRNLFIWGPFEAMEAWSLETELTAIDKLAELVSEHMYKAYILTGAFLETSKRSGITYLFRRLKPTVAMTPHGSRRDYFYGRENDNMTILATLCAHMIGYYSKTFCGVMVPTDEVIAHLLLMRGDEHMFWRRANQHAAWEPESGL